MINIRNKLKLHLIVFASLISTLFGCFYSMSPEKNITSNYEKFVEVMAFESDISILDEIVPVSTGAKVISIHNALVYRLPARPSDLGSMNSPYYIYLLVTNIDRTSSRYIGLFNSYWANTQSFTEVSAIARISNQTLIPFILPVTSVDNANINSTYLMNHYDIATALTLKSKLGADFENETMMIVGSPYPFSVNMNVLTDLSDIAVIGLTNSNQAEISQVICKINKIVISEQYTGSLTQKLKKEHINIYVRKFNLILENLGSFITPSTAIAQELC
ncbi:MAG TPA: hypothetical protein DG048_17715 [Pseudoalteromonas sp.]|nr:hypothetical protein [Pseudoalteromonas sp.]